MKSILIYLTVLAMAICSCHTEESNTATIDLSSPVQSDADFIFSTCKGQTLIMANATAAQKMSNNLKKKTGGILSDLGIGNAFVLTISDTMFLCTARHTTIGLEKYSRNIGADISLIDYTTMTKQNPGGIILTNGYELDTTVKTGDSIFIRGYLFNKEGLLQSVTVSGRGTLVNKKEYINNVIGKNQQYIQDRVLVIKLHENTELGGLSGSPVFNKQGKVIGVYAGRIWEQEENAYFIRVSLFS